MIVYWMLYIAKSAFFLLLFYLFFKVFLSNETFHSFNRYLLLTGLTLSLLLPSIPVSVEQPRQWQQSLHRWETQLLTNDVLAQTTAPTAAEPTTGIVPTETETTHTSLHWIVAIYLLGVLFRLSRLAYTLICIRRIVSTHKQRRFQLYTLVITPYATAPYSWQRYIVISEEDYRENANEIISHELAHITLRHSADLLFLELATALQWFNPTIYLLRREMQSIHEYQADSSVLHQGIHPSRYQLLIIKKAVGSDSYIIANSFSHSTLKKRFTMMFKKKSNKAAMLKALGILPLAALALTLFARPEIDKAAKLSDLKVTDTTGSKQEKTIQYHSDTIINGKKRVTQIKGAASIEETREKLRACKKVFTRHDGKEISKSQMNVLEKEDVEFVGVWFGNHIPENIRNRGYDGYIILDTTIPPPPPAPKYTIKATTK